MHIQNSYKDKATGTLYVVPTPIGNLEDMTFRAINILRKVNIIAAEDTRETRKLLTHFEIENPLISYHEHNRASRSEQLLGILESGEDIAIVSDAGMPAISDPGYELVQEVLAEKLNVVVLPGANAAICALVGSGLPTSEFLFHGFLPRKKQEKERVLKRLSRIESTLIFYESPYRVKETLKLFEKVLGNRKVAIVRELSKIYEQYIRGDIAEVSDWLLENDLKGECCIVVEGFTGESETDSWWDQLTIAAHVDHYESQEGLPHKEALKRVAKDRNVSRREIYQEIHAN